MSVRRIAAVVATAALVLSACSGGGHPAPTTRIAGGRPSAVTSPSATSTSVRRASLTERLLGLSALPSSSSPLPGYLMIADRDNNRVIVVAPDHRIVWRFPRSGDLRPAEQFRGPDDAFFTPDGRHLITNEEFADTIAVVSLGPHPRISWTYGHANSPGSAHGYLAHPDDAYLRSGGLVSVADIENCRVLWIDRRGRVKRSIGHAGNCTHNPPASISQPNGDTPLPDGGTLVTEIGGWVDRFDATGRLVWSVRSPTTYPSDAQLLPDGNVLVAGFNTPGRVDVIRPNGRIIWTYQHTSGGGELDRPSLAIALPNGTIAVTDDWHHRVVLIDRRTKRIVWQYGHDHVAGHGPGYLNKPDGLALVP